MKSTGEPELVDWILLGVAGIIAVVLIGMTIQYRRSLFDTADETVEQPSYEFGPLDHPGFLDPIPDDEETPDPKVRRVIAKTLFYEAAGEGEHGLLLVASVIHNRAGSGRDFKAVCLRPRQFSCWNDGWLSVPTNPIDLQAYELCLQIADEMLAGSFAPITTATHYHADYVHPYWADHYAKLVQYRRHIFYR